MSVLQHDSTELCLQLSGKSDQPQKIYKLKSKAENITLFKPSGCKKKARKLYACSLCSFSSNISEQLHKHVAEKHGGASYSEQRYLCGVCEQKFVYIGPMKIHMRSHTNERPFKCPQCSYAGKTQSALSNHVRMHTGEKPWTCEHCGRDFTRLDSMKRHISAHHTGHRPFKCNMCSYASVTQNSLKLHILAKHKKEKPYKCAQCDFSTCYKADLSVHERSHTGVKPYMCPHCTYASSNSSDLVKHVRRHTGDRLFKCRHCDYTSTEKQTVEVHERGSHSNLRPFQCPHCPYRTAYQSHLPRHIQRIHVEGRTARNAKNGSRKVMKSHSQETILALQKLKRLNSTDVDSTSNASFSTDTDTEDQKTTICPKNDTTTTDEKSIAPHPNLWVPGFPSPVKAQPVEPAVKREREHPFFNINWMREHWNNGDGADAAVEGGAVERNCWDNLERVREEITSVKDIEEGSIEVKNEEPIVKNTDGDYVCIYCDRSFTDKNMWTQHISRHK
ncbi:zinc finger protein 431-like [Branchiostoma floridae]|uniref:Zinc finger protein 431-like n=1 Tax=Branchiostoma floridae TaxID=7739 RepID=A0A9J7L0W3_BRAFL|nr:zinc finger protein 431-like [Branchiostoma floridae]